MLRPVTERSVEFRAAVVERLTALDGQATKVALHAALDGLDLIETRLGDEMPGGGYQAILETRQKVLRALGGQ